MSPLISPNITWALHTNAEPSWNSAGSSITPPETASPYSAMEVSRSVLMSMSLKLVSPLSSSPTTFVLASSTRSLAASTASWAEPLGTSVDAVILSSERAVLIRASRTGSAAFSCGAMES